MKRQSKSSKKVSSHLKKDIKEFKEQISEDKNLLKSIAPKKSRKK